MPSTKVSRAIAAFESAVMDKAFAGTITYENEEGVETRLAIEHNYVKARAKLERLMENL